MGQSCLGIWLGSSQKVAACFFSPDQFCLVLWQPQGLCNGVKVLLIVEIQLFSLALLRCLHCMPMLVGRWWLQLRVKFYSARWYRGCRCGHGACVADGILGGWERRQILCQSSGSTLGSRQGCYSGCQRRKPGSREWHISFASCQFAVCM